MDGDLYDEFGNYIGPELESDESSEEEDLEDNAAGEEVGIICILPEEMVCIVKEIACNPAAHRNKILASCTTKCKKELL